jgi:FlaA1/EpsC-like NDP-sugar epimerase
MNNFLIKLKNLSRNHKLFILAFTDFFIAFSCWVIFGPPFSFLIASSFEISLLEVISRNYLSFLIPFFFTLIFFIYSGFYRSMMKFFNSKDTIKIALTGSTIFGFSWAAVYLNQYELIRANFLTTVFLQALLLSAVFYAFLQISRDAAGLILYPSKLRFHGKPILIYGAGAAGIELYHALKLNPSIRIVGFFDNSLALKGAEIDNIKVFGKKKHIKEFSEKYPNMEIYLAMPSLSIQKRREVINGLEEFRVAVRSMPALHELIADDQKMLEMQDLSIDDILPRKRVNKADISFSNISVLITGAGGSIGSELVKQVLSGNPKRIVLYDISEINLYSIESEINSIKTSKNISSDIIGVLGDVKDTNRLQSIISNYDVEYIYHAAAYKHVPIVEFHENISEGIKNNVFGTKSVCEAAINGNVKKVVIISTDKAVRPTNIMGASKRFAEMIAQSLDNSSQGTTLCMVRFGNVLNSSGSVLPLFRKQIAEGGPLTLTHKEVTRFFMTISEASSLVIQAGEFAIGGDVFILDMGEQVKIIDLAKRLIYLSGRNIKYDEIGEGIEIKEVGLRPGEKLYEELLISGEVLQTLNSKIFKSIEAYPSKDILDKATSDLFDSLKNNDVQKIRSIFKKYIEGFTDEVIKP